MHMQHQHEASASDIGDGSHITCNLKYIDKSQNHNYSFN